MNSLLIALLLFQQPQPKCEWGRAVVRVTRTSTAITKDTVALYVNSTRCMQASTPVEAWLLYIEGEVMPIREIQNGIVIVQRGQGRRPSASHEANVSVFFGPARNFLQ